MSEDMTRDELEQFPDSVVDEEMIKVLDSVIERYKLDCPSPVKVTLEALARIKQLLAQKPRVVTREWVNEFIGLGVMAASTGDYEPIEGKFKELGVEVKEE